MKIFPQITLQSYTQTNKIQWEFSKVGDAEGSGAVGGSETGGVGDPPSIPTPDRVPTPDLPIASGGHYTIGVAGTDLYLGVPPQSNSKHPATITPLLKVNPK